MDRLVTLGALQGINFLTIDNFRGIETKQVGNGGHPRNSTHGVHEVDDMTISLSGLR